MKPYTVVQNALLMPFAGNRGAFRSGAFARGELVPGSLQSRGLPAEPLAAEKRLEGAFLFGGYLFRHYGHFLLESLSRLYAWRECPKLPLLFMSPGTAVDDWHIQVLRGLGIDNEAHIITVPTEVASLVVSPPGSSVEPDFILPEQLRALAAISGPPPRTGKKVWLSRCRFVHQGKGSGVLNEIAVIQKLQARGWEIVEPEALDGIRQQVALFTSAEVVAGFEGSAFYTALLAKTCNARCVFFTRRPDMPPTLPTIFTAKGLDFAHHTPRLDLVEKAGDGLLYFLPDIDEILNVLP